MGKCSLWSWVWSVWKVHADWVFLTSSHEDLFSYCTCIFLLQARGLLHEFRKKPKIPCTLYGLCSQVNAGMWDSGHAPTVECITHLEEEVCPYNSNPSSPVFGDEWNSLDIYFACFIIMACLTSEFTFADMVKDINSASMIRHELWCKIDWKTICFCWIQTIKRSHFCFIFYVVICQHIFAKKILAYLRCHVCCAFYSCIHMQSPHYHNILKNLRRVGFIQGAKYKLET